MNLEGEAFLTPFTQAKSLKDFCSSIFREDYEKPAVTLPVPTVFMPAPQVSTPVVQRELSGLVILNEDDPYAIYRRMVRWIADVLAEPLEN